MRGPAEGGSALTRREREVAALVAEGLTNRQIAERLFISERTADGHLEHIREKLGVSSRASIAAWHVDQERPSLTADELLRADVGAGREASTRVRRVRVIAGLALVVATMVTAGVVAVHLRSANSPPNGSPVITTIAGVSRVGRFEGGYSGDFGPASAAQLYHPLGMAMGADGTLYVSDWQNSAVRSVDAGGTITTVAGGGPSSLVDGALGPSVRLPRPMAVAPGAHGVLYIASGQYVIRLDPDLSLHLVLGPSSPQAVTNAEGLAAAPDGSLYIADHDGHTVKRVAGDGSISTYAGNGQEGFSGDGGAASGAQLSYPAGLALDSRGNLYIADQGNNRIRRVEAATGTIGTVAGSSDTYGYGGDGGQAAQARLSLPGAVAVDPNGRMYIADTGNNRIRQVTTGGVITTVAGTGVAGFRGDGGPATMAELSGPGGLAIAPSGALYVADSANNRIRKFEVRPRD